MLKNINVFNKLKKRTSVGDNFTVFQLVRQLYPYLVPGLHWAPPPLSVFFIINGVCNLHCKMCDVAQDKNSIFAKNMLNKKMPNFPIDRFESLMEEFSTFRPFISITATEPLLYPELSRAIHAIKKNGMQVNITTNGYLLEKCAEDLISAGLDKITISIDGPADIHNEIRGSKNVFQKALNGISQLVEIREKYGVHTPSIRINTCVLPQTAGRHSELLRQLPMAHIDLVTVSPYTFATPEMVENHNKAFPQYPLTEMGIAGGYSPKNVDYKLAIKDLSFLKKKYKNKLYVKLGLKEVTNQIYYEKPSQFIDRAPCIFPWISAQITCNGDLIGLTRCYDKRHGNILNQSFLSVWNGLSMKQFRRDLKKQGRFPGCSRCDGTTYLANSTP